jgi:hypothetical protein
MKIFTFCLTLFSLLFASSFNLMGQDLYVGKTGPSIAAPADIISYTITYCIGGTDTITATDFVPPGSLIKTL